MNGFLFSFALLCFALSVGLSWQDTSTLLRHFGWDADKLLDKYTEAPEETLIVAGVLPRHDVDAPGTKRARLAFTCSICFDEEDVQPVSAACGHQFCDACYTYYIRQKITEEGESFRICCPHEKCKVVVPYRLVMQLMDSAVQERYVSSYTRVCMFVYVYMCICVFALRGAHDRSLTPFFKKIP